MTGEQSTWSSPPEPASSSTDKGVAELGEIVVFIDGTESGAGILEFAGAPRSGASIAHLIAVFMQPEPALTPPETFALGEGIREVIDAHQAQLEEIEAHHRALFDNIVRRHGIRLRSGRPLSHLSSDVVVYTHSCGPGGDCPPGPCGPDNRPSLAWWSRSC